MTILPNPPLAEPPGLSRSSAFPRLRHWLRFGQVRSSTKAYADNIQALAVGSLDWTSWADVLLHVRHKRIDLQVVEVLLDVEPKGQVTPDPFLLVLSHYQHPILRAFPAYADDLERALPTLPRAWSVTQLQHSLGVSRATAYRRWLRFGQVRPVPTRRLGSVLYSSSRYLPENET